MRTPLLALLLFAGCGDGSDSGDPENCVVYYDGCNGNACEPLCVPASEAVPCDVECQSPQQPEGDCVFFGTECQFR